MEQPKNPVKIFCCYAREDEALLNELESHLRSLERRDLIKVWHDRSINAGVVWGKEIHKRLKEAQIILLLISSDFINSEYCYGTEMRQAVERYERNEVKVIPIILRPVIWDEIPIGNITLGDLQALPKDARSVTTWDNRDEAWKDVVKAIGRVVNELLTEPLINQSPVPLYYPQYAQRRSLTAFICSGFNNKERGIADILYDRLKECNIQPWVYKGGMMQGIVLESERRRQVESCDVLIPCISSKFLDISDGYEYTEVRIALKIAEEQKSIYMVPLLLGPFKKRPDEFRGLNCIEYSKEDGFQQLMSVLEEKRRHLNTMGENIQPFNYHIPLKKTSSLITRRKLLIAAGGVAFALVTTDIMVSFVHSQQTVEQGSRIPSSVKAPSASLLQASSATTLVTNFFESNGLGINALAWSPDGRKMAVAYENNYVGIWDVLKAEVEYRYQGHIEPVEGVSWSPDGKHVVSGSADGTARIWDEYGETSVIYTGHKEIDINTQHPWINCVQWSPNGNWIASCDQTNNDNANATIQIWDPQNGNTRTTYSEHKNSVYSVAWSPDSKYIASVGYDGTLRIWEAASGNTLGTVSGSPTLRLYGVSWSPDNQYIVFGGNDCIVRLTNLVGAQPLPVYQLPSKAGHGIRAVVYSPKGNYYAVSTDGQGVFIFEANTNAMVHWYKIQDVPGDILALGWSPTKPEIAMGNNTGSTSYSVGIWKTLLDS